MVWVDTKEENKNLSLLVLFIGFNHQYKKMVIFEAAFSFNEITESFKHERIFNAFKSKKPKFIFTDQYPVIAKVLATVMLEMLQR